MATKLPDKKQEILAVVRIRGVRNMKPKIKFTLGLLRLHRPNHCVVVKGSEQMKGMLQIAKDYIAYGDVSEEMLLKLLKKRGEKGGKMLLDSVKEQEIEKAAKEIMNGEDVKKLVDPVFRLHPPRKGYKDIKSAYPRGDLGKRPDMDTLLKRMM